MRDYYEVLSVERDADADTIKRAYRKLALKYHPDRNSGSKDAEDRFKEATEAYEVLRDPEKRANYDRFGHAGVKGAAGASGGYAGFDFSDALNIFMRDFGGFGFEDIFGGRGGSSGRRARKGADAQIRLPITLEEVASGVRKTIRLKVLDPCSACDGSGGEDGAAPVSCEACGGSGEVRRVQRSVLGQLVSVTPCPTCGGEGQRIETPCHNCSGEGVERVSREVAVDVPAGVSAGDYITLRGQGNSGLRGGPRGDIIVILDVEEDARFTRDGADLVHDLAVTFTQAALGAEVEVPTVEGTARLKIPAGTQSGRHLRMRGQGLPHLRGGGQGDLIVRVAVWVPTELSSEQESLLHELSKVESPAPDEVEVREGDQSFWSKVRGAFSA